MVVAEEHLKTHMCAGKQLVHICLLPELVSVLLLIMYSKSRPVNLHCAMKWLMRGGGGGGLPCWNEELVPCVSCRLFLAVNYCFTVIFKPHSTGVCRNNPASL